MIQSQQNKYLETNIQTASPAKLLLLLFDGAIKFSRLGQEMMLQQDITMTHINLCKAQDIINEFMASLDQSSPIAEGLMQIYEYIHYLLVQANMKKDPALIDEAVGYLTELRDTWREAAKLSAASTPLGVNHA